MSLLFLISISRIQTEKADETLPLLFSDPLQECVWKNDFKMRIRLAS